MAGAFNRYGHLPAAQFADKIRGLAAIENPEDVPVYRDAVSDRMDRQLAAERGRFNAPVRGDTVADKVRFLNQINNSVPEPPAPPPSPPRQPVVDSMPTTPRGPRLESGFDFKEYYRPPSRGLSGLGIASAVVAPVLLAQAYKYLKGEE
jgi:hypothetical protein